MTALCCKKKEKKRRRSENPLSTQGEKTGFNFKRPLRESFILNLFIISCFSSGYCLKKLSQVNREIFHCYVKKSVCELDYILLK